VADFHLLIVDDDKDLAEGLAEYFELVGHRADIVHTGAAGIERALEGDYAAVLMDVGLPDMSGIDCFVQIRERNPDLPVFLMTGFSIMHMEEQGIDVDRFTILTKPVQPDMVLDQLSPLAAAASA
jgi:DNA-binding response OmpR family regulator